jgi:hypothetical protein
MAVYTEESPINEILQALDHACVVIYCELFTVFDGDSVWSRLWLRVWKVAELMLPLSVSTRLVLTILVRLICCALVVLCMLGVSQSLSRNFSND